MRSIIARNEVGNLNAEINQQRSKELGIEKAQWMTVSDERVRGRSGGLYPNARPSHWARNGEVYDINKGIDGEFPGMPVNCRCYAVSVIDLD